MGCCFSKCKVRKDSSHHHVHDKLVISQDHNTAAMSSDHTPPPPPKSPVLLNRKPTSPPPSSDQSSTFSSFSCSTAASSSLRSTSTSTSSVLMQIAKDGRSSFSNEFLRSCAEENPHIVRMKKHPSKTLEKPPINAAAAPPPYRKKRDRANSPPAGSLVRQKSFRRSSPQHYYNHSKINPNVGNMRSPLNHASSCRRQIVSNSKAGGAFVDYSSPMMYRSFDRNFADDHVMETEMEMDSTFCASAHELANKIGQDHRILRSRQEDDGVEELDINNPLIALDCFIFL